MAIVLVKPVTGAGPTFVYWHGARLGFVEHHVDGWHAYTHPLLDPANSRHRGPRAHDTRAAALHAIVSTFNASNRDVVLLPDGLRCRVCWWDETGDEHQQVIDLHAERSGAWTATELGSATSGAVQPAASLHGLFEVRSGNPARFCGHATNLYSAATLLVTTDRKARTA